MNNEHNLVIALVNEETDIPFVLESLLNLGLRNETPCFGLRRPKRKSEANGRVVHRKAFAKTYILLTSWKARHS